MSDPTYRIDVERRPLEHPPIRWVSRVFRISDERFITSFHRETEERAVTDAQEWIASESTKQPGYSLFVDDDGRPVEGHSFTAHTVRGDNVTTTAREDRSDDPAGHSVRAP